MSRNLICVQAKLSAAPYESAAAFRAYVYDLCERALDAAPSGNTLLAFPEAIGFPLVFSLGGADILRLGNTTELARALLRRDWCAAFLMMLRYRAFGLNAFFLPHAVAAHRAYVDTFAHAAKDFGVTIQAGSSFLPKFENEPSKGLHLENGRVYNLAYTFAPTGKTLARHAKVHLTKGLESSLNFSKGSLPELTPLQTPVGKVGVAICLDGFYDSVAAHYDALGTEILVQPSANFASWSRPWAPDPNLSEGEAWLSQGLAASLQDRLHLRYGLNPMLVGELWGLRAEGRTSISVNAGLEPDINLEGYKGLAAIAETHDEEAFVRYSV